MEDNKHYLAPGDVASLFPGLSTDRLARWRWARTGPSYIKAGRQILYLATDVERFLTQCRVETGRVLS